MTSTGPDSAAEPLNLQPVPTLALDSLLDTFARADGLSEPVLLRSEGTAAPAFARWTLERLCTRYGHAPVGVIEGNWGRPGRQYMRAARTQPFESFLRRLHAGEDVRLFLFDLFRHDPSLLGDLPLPPCSRQTRPYLFFGGRNSVVPLHFDIDLCHVLRGQIAGRAQVTLFPPSASKRLYRHPLTARSYVDVERPSAAAFPRSRGLQGWTATLGPGDLLLMPSGTWHHFRYLEPGWAFSQRAKPVLSRRLLGLRNMLLWLPVDNLLNAIAPNPWFEVKRRLA